MTDQLTPGAARVLASDADREHTSDALRGHFAEGRLTADELAQRLDETYGARTLDELGRALRELPGALSTRPRHQLALGKRGPLFIGILATAITLSIITGTHVFWAVWPLGWLWFHGRIRPRRVFPGLPGPSGRPTI